MKDLKQRIVECLRETYKSILEENAEKTTGVYIYTDSDASAVHIRAIAYPSQLRDEHNVVLVHKWSNDEYTWRDYARIDGETIPDDSDDIDRLRDEEVSSVLDMPEVMDDFEEWAEAAIEQLENSIKEA